MRLLRAKTLQFRDVLGDDIPQYAILSHRWGSHELTYKDMHTAIDHGGGGSKAREIRKTQGFKKIWNFSRRALNDGYEYIWADTCCIDKSSSAELQEAINSMYQWYKDSEVCYAYLADVLLPDVDVYQHKGLSSHAAWIESFQKSEWFTRGWTLQELLAPRKLVFFDRQWRKCDPVSDLTAMIKQITGIPAKYLDMCEDRPKMWEVRVARRMAWAANRQTTRIEDLAYSLLGLFDVCMPMLYGEGPRAFQRLQEQILTVSGDASILAWSCIDADTDFTPNGLAKSPAHFQRYPDLVGSQMPQPSFVDLDATMTPRGLQVRLDVQKDFNDQAIGYAVLMNTQQHNIRSRSPSQSLVLPIMFTRSTFSQSEVKNEVVRFSDPLWVSSKFLRKAQSMSVCFIRHVQAADVNHGSSGFSLRSHVWHQYATSFTYPLQTKPGHRHVPAIFGGSLTNTVAKDKDHTLVWELVTRTNPTRRFGILIGYRLINGARISDVTVTVLKLQKPMHLSWASCLAGNRNYRRGSTYCDLLDRKGRIIAADEIVDIRSFPGYWTHAGDDELDDLSIRPAAKPEVIQLNAVKEMPVC